MERVTFLIVGFNLYHSLCQASDDMNLSGRGTKWLDIRSLCQSYIHLFGKESFIQDVFYFSAFAYHRLQQDPLTVARHKRLVKCLQDSGVIIEMSRFKTKAFACPNCREKIVRHEEKETDVAIASKLIELFYTEQCDTISLVSGDTDLVPAIYTARRLFPKKDVLFCFPYKRVNNLLKSVAPQSFTIKKEQYRKHQFPEAVSLSTGEIVRKPSTW